MLHYEITGTGKEYLVLLHGFMENSFIWEDLQPFLSKKFKLVKIDLPGHGQSPCEKEIHTMDFMAEKVKEVTDKLQMEKFHLLGHSMGGYTALAFAEAFGNRLQSLTLFFSTFAADDEEKKETRRRSLRIVEDSLKTFVAAGVPNLFNPYEKKLLESKIELAQSIALSTPTKGITAAIKGMIERPDRKSVLETFDQKILILAGKHDNAVKSLPMLSQLPEKENLKSYLLDCGHNGHWEKPEICAAIINTELLQTPDS
ncbi:alpha/beta fold hydrolase [Bergeyella sp. RCAD1439]|uniref:alpha/beta fold hydrolase n=1 Tax=Bergeyella anatis TaxID=3113737 RepID=UPI002E19AE63|nr:alpha/beta fold hydrolase [Bergeyella sp. RCAD1439]